MNPFASRRRRTTVPFNDLSFSAASRRVASPAAALCTVTEFYGRFHLMPYILDQTPRNRRGRIYSCCRYKVIYYTRSNAQFKGLHVSVILQKNNLPFTQLCAYVSWVIIMQLYKRNGLRNNSRLWQQQKRGKYFISVLKERRNIPVASAHFRCSAFAAFRSLNTFCSN